MLHIEVTSTPLWPYSWRTSLAFAFRLWSDAAWTTGWPVSGKWRGHHTTTKNTVFICLIIYLSSHYYFFVYGFPRVLGFMTCVPFHLLVLPGLSHLVLFFLFLFLQVRFEFSQSWWGLPLRSDTGALHSVCVVFCWQRVPLRSDTGALQCVCCVCLQWVVWNISSAIYAKEAVLK